MEIALFWLVVNVVFWMLRLRPNSLVSRTAFTWFGPKPIVGELFSRYQVRWSMYSLSWLIQFALAFSILLVVIGKPGLTAIEGFSGVLFFALPFGIGMAALAAAGFGLAAAKAHFMGPNPAFMGGIRDHAA